MKEKTSFLRRPAVQTLLASLLCILMGLLIGFVVLLLINAQGAWKALTDILKNFWTFNRQNTQLKNLGNTLVKTAPLLMCSLAVLFAYKVGLFNIGAAGQYVAGAGMALYTALALDWPWWACMIAAMLAGACLGAISGALKAYRSVNEVISGIMLNWIGLYLVNTLLAPYMNIKTAETWALAEYHPNSMIPTCGLGDLFGKNKYVTIAIPAAVVIAFAIWILLTKTKLGYELRATGLNRNAAQYCGMRYQGNIVLTMAIAGALAGLGAGMYYLTDNMRWPTTVTSVPGMGFNGIAAAFLGGLHPIGAIFSSFFIQHITDGGAMLDVKTYPSEISGFISAIVIYMCAFVLFFKQTITRMLDAKKEKALMKRAGKGATEK